MVPEQLQSAIEAHNWYVVAAIFITLFTQLVRKKNVPVFTFLWNKLPDGWRFIWPLLTGGLTGFADGILTTGTVQAGIIQAAVGLFGIGGVSMGLASALKESHLPWDGAAGGKLLTDPKKADGSANKA